jgi:coproporphyrinogen III oxidase-like Fe-S oxidoreductase
MYDNNRLCPYCAFNKYRQPTNYTYRDELRMQEALVAEMKHVLNAYIPYKLNVASIYFGGRL